MSANDEFPVQCVRCEYDLRDIADDQPCPECGLLAIHSRTLGERLHETRPGWLRSLSWGIRLMMLALVGAVLWPIIEPYDGRRIHLLSVFEIVQRYALPDLRGRADALVFGVFTLLFAIGALRFTVAEGYAPADRRDRARRRTIRVLGFVPLLAVALSTAIEEFRLAAQLVWTDLATLIFLLLVAALPLLLCLQARNLAKRASSAHLAEHAAIVGIGTTSSIVFLTMLIAFEEFSRPSGFNGRGAFVEGSIFWLALLLTASVSINLFSLWAGYLFIRFSFAFAKASKQVRTIWRRDDRALTDDERSDHPEVTASPNPDPHR